VARRIDKRRQLVFSQLLSRLDHNYKRFNPSAGLLDHPATSPASRSNASGEGRDSTTSPAAGDSS
jgi:hypothetical protein